MKTIYGMMMVAVTALFCVFCGCSQDDDYYDSDMYTLAEMGTRMAEGGEGGDPGGGGNVDEEFTIKRSVEWKKTGNDSVTIGTCDVKLKMEYDHYSMGGNISYDGHDGKNYTDIIVSGHCAKVGKELHYTANLRANYIYGNDSTISVTGSVEGSFKAFK